MSFKVLRFQGSKVLRFCARASAEVVQALQRRPPIERRWAEISGGIVSAPAQSVAGVRRFQELVAHKLAVELRRKVFRLTARVPVRHDYEFVRQIRNSARGAPRNIAEGFSRFVPSENRHFLSYATASLDETKNHLADALDSQYFTQEEYADLLTLTDRTLAAVSGMMRYLESDQAKRAYHKVRDAQRSKWHRKRPEPEP